MNSCIKLILFSLSFSAIAQSIGFNNFVPNYYDSETPVFVVLHGCKQKAEDILRDTYFTDYAEKNQAIVFTPEQSLMNNWDHCWNWFLPANQQSFIISETQTIMAELSSFLLIHDIQLNPVYLVGFSSGAAQALNLLACHPESFQGAALHSGIAYRVAQDVFEADQVIQTGPRESNEELAQKLASCSDEAQSWAHMKILLFHGSVDSRVVPANQVSIKNQFLSFYDYLDDKEFNNSHIYDSNFEVKTPIGKYPYQQETHEFYNNSILHSYLIQGLAHDWSGGNERLGRNDPLGPNATEMIFDILGN